MKRLILLLSLCSFLTRAQGVDFIDDAVQGPTGNHQQLYSGSWIHNNTSPDFYNGTLSYSNQTGAYIEISFAGNALRWVAEKKHTHGTAAVYLDGDFKGTIDLYSATPEIVTVYETPNTLEQGNHTFRIEVSGGKNPASTGYYVVHDHVVISQDTPPNPLPDNSNTRLGESALPQLLFGFNNTAIGAYTLSGTYNGSGNSSLGAYAGKGIDKGSFNTALGYNAIGGSGAYLLFNTAIGYSAMDIDQPGDGNTAVGAESGPSVSNLLYSTAVGAGTKTTANFQVRIGNSSVTSIGGPVSWSTLSDGRFKNDIQENVAGLSFINGLRPVSYVVNENAVARFHGEPELNEQASKRKKEVRQTGFVAQEVDALVKKSGYVFNGVQVPENEHDTYSIRYAEFVVPLVKAVQELSAKVEAQQQEIDALRKINDRSLDLSKKWASAVLYQNTPNPFSLDTKIDVAVPDGVADAKILVYNLEGKQLKSLDVKGRGETSVLIQGHEFGPGMYLYTLIMDGELYDTKKMVLVK